MAEQIFRITSISQLHTMLQLESPKHPLISLIDTADLQVPEQNVGTKVIYDFYTIIPMQLIV